MDIDNRSVVSGHYHTLTITTPVAHKIPGTMVLDGGVLSAGTGITSIVSDGYYDGERTIDTDKVILADVERSGYYKITSNGKGVVSKSSITKQVTKTGFVEEDPEPVEIAAEETIESENAEKAYYIKKSTLTEDHLSPTSDTQLIVIGEGYYPKNRTITFDPVERSFPTTSLSSVNMAAYFYSANQNDYDIQIIPRYSNRAGYVIDHTNTNNGGTEYYKIKNTAITESATTVDGSNVSRGSAYWNEGWITSGQIEAATLRNSPTTGKTYVDISNTSEAPVLTSGDYLYIDSGYVDNLKISLAKLVPDAATQDVTADYILSGYRAYNNDGNIITDVMQTYDGSYVIN